MLVYGKNVAKEVIGVKKIKTAYIYKDILDKDILNSLNNINCKIKYVERKYLDKMIDGLHQGIVLDIEDYKYFNIEDINEDLIVILDHLEDPHNFGAIIRTCEAAGIKSIIIPKDRSVEVNGTVYKTSVGTLSKVKIIQVTNLVNTMNYLKKQGFWIVGTDMQGEDYKKINYDGKTAIVIGNEGAGMSRLVHDNCDFVASIKMNGEVNSLNASVAAGIIIFEAVRGK